MNALHFDRDEVDRLIAKLVCDPEAFERGGFANDLLKQFLRGHPIDVLRRLLHHSDGGVTRAAIWIASELPVFAPALLSDALPALTSPDRYVRFYALDVVMLGAVGEDEEEFVRVVEALDDPDVAVKDHALFLISHATNGQILAAIKRFRRADPSSHHLPGLGALADARSANPIAVREMIESNSEVDRKYGLAIAERCYDVHPDLLEMAARSGDKLIRSLAAHMLKQHGIAKARRD